MANSIVLVGNNVQRSFRLLVDLYPKALLPEGIFTFYVMCCPHSRAWTPR